MNLFDPANPKNTWKLADGIDFTFPGGATIPASGYALIVKTSPAFFRAKYAIPASVPIFGPYLNSLNNDRDTVELKRPGDPPAPGASAPYIRVDRVGFTDSTPWPISADGRGASLNRVTAGDYGDDVANWQAGHGTPGAAFTAFDATPPSVPGIPTTQIISSTRTNLAWSAGNDPQSGVAFYYIYANGKRMAATTTTSFSDIWVSAAAGPRTYQISAVNGDGVESLRSGAVLTASITAVAPDPRITPVSQITIVFSAAVSGFDLSDLTLKLDGGANLLTAVQTLTTTDNMTWTLGNLSGLTAGTGNYVLTLKASSSGIVNGANEALGIDTGESWSVDSTAPTVSIVAVTPDPRAAAVDQITVVFSEAAANFDLSDLTLKRNGGGNLLTASQTLTSADGITWTLGNLGGLTNIAGTYQLIVIAGPGVTDLAGNALSAGASDSWVMSVTSQTPFDTTDDQLGTVTAQGENGAAEGMLKAFDNASSTKWLDFATANPTTRASWIQYQYASNARYVVTQYTITSANDAPERDPRDWQLLGSSDGGANWVTLDTRLGETFSDRFVKKSYSVDNTVAYKIYRLNITSVAGPGSANSVQLSEIELIGLPPPPPPTVVNAAFDADLTRSLSFRFSQSVQQSLSAIDIKVRNLTTSQDIAASAPVYDPATDTATFNFASLPDGNYTATLLAPGINDPAGSLLDGNADGTEGDAYVFPFFVLAGDANHDRNIGFADLVAIAQNYGKIGGATAANGDSNRDGNVDFADLVVVAQKYGTSLAAPVPAPLPAPAPALLPITAATKPPQAPALASSVPDRKDSKSIFSVIPISKPVPRKPAPVRGAKLPSLHARK